MGLWLFRRKSRRKRSRGNLSDGEDGERGRDAQQAPPNRRQTEPANSKSAETRDRSQQSKKQRTEPTKLQRRTRTYSFSPGRNDAIRIDPTRSPKRKHQSAPQAPKTHATTAAKRKNDGYKVDSGVGALGEDVFPRAPTLHNKRGGDNSVPRKKSSKRRRRSDQVREAEIKAMSQFVPHRLATDDNTAGRPMKKESRSLRTGLHFPFGKPEWDKENRSSDISLPIPESLHSSLSSDSDHVAFKVSAFEALAPRPTLRYDVHPRSAATLPAKLLSKRSPYPEATIRAHKRIDDLANDLSASDLRELMERDKRRRDRKLQTDQEKMGRRLARRAEKQRSDEELAADIGGEPPKNLERGVIGRELVGLGIDTTSAVVTSSRRRHSNASSKRSSNVVSEKDDIELEGDEKRARPLDSFHRMSSIATETPLSPHSEKETLPPLPELGARDYLRSKKSRTSSLTASGTGQEALDKAQKGSEGGLSRRASLWASIFKWGSKNRRNSGPSSFSNTSRDSMPFQPQPPGLPATFVPPRKPSTGVPKRTMSRFREDLPELPQLAPEPRSSWSGADPIPPTITEQSPDADARDEGEEAQDFSPPATTHMVRYDTPTSLDRSVEGMRQTPTSLSRRDELQPSPAPHSMSLASMDSEGSWLSGRLAGRRRSGGMPDTLFRIQDHTTSSQGGSDGTIGSAEHDNDGDMPGEDHSLADDEYLSRYARQSGTEPKWKRKSTGEARPSSDEDEEARWGAVRENLPTMIHGRSSERLKSREGFLNTFDNDDDDTEGDEDHDDEKDELAVQRATSINLGKGHVRHISAGSARLLDLTPRSSVDARRRSLGA